MSGQITRQTTFSSVSIRELTSENCVVAGPSS